MALRTESNTGDVPADGKLHHQLGYHAPLTPFQRVQAHPAVPQSAKDALVAQFAQLDPVVLLHEIRPSQARLTAMADATSFPESDRYPKADVSDFLDGLRYAWKEGEVRPTARRRPPAPRGRRRPDPLVSVTDVIKAWFDEDQSQTGRELLCRLQAAHPDAYPDALLRTVQRRLKVWRGDMAKALVFGSSVQATRSSSTAVALMILLQFINAFFRRRSRAAPPSPSNTAPSMTSAGLSSRSECDQRLPEVHQQCR